MSETNEYSDEAFELAISEYVENVNKEIEIREIRRIDNVSVPTPQDDKRLVLNPVEKARIYHVTYSDDAKVKDIVIKITFTIQNYR